MPPYQQPDGPATEVEVYTDQKPFTRMQHTLNVISSFTRSQSAITFYTIYLKMGMNDDFFTELVITLQGTFDEVNKSILEHMEKVKYDVLNSIYFKYRDVPLFNTSGQSKNMDDVSISINKCLGKLLYRVMKGSDCNYKAKPGSKYSGKHQNSNPHIIMSQTREEKNVTTRRVSH